MRPLQLKMTAFGPYKDTEMIDFKELENHNLFVISGNTGSGKTTIFDGICFALYGSASGQDRESHTMLRSDFADDDDHTSVELEFILNDRIYRIKRQLGHVKQGNKTKTGEQYSFFEKIDGREVPCVDRQIVSEIDRKVEELMGLTEDQFKQIVMLPQGEFRKLLTSETENKEAILRRLFKTEPYKQITEQLKNKKDRLEKDFLKDSQMRDHFIQTIRASLPKREGSPLFDILSEDHYNINQVITGLEEENSFYKQQSIIDRKKYDEAYQAHDKKQTELHQSKTVNEQFEELDKKKNELKELELQKQTFIERTEQLEQADKASRIEPYEQQVRLIRKEEKEQADRLKDVKKERQEVQERLLHVQNNYEQEEKKQAERDDYRKQLEKLYEYLPEVKEIDQQKAYITTLAEAEKKTSQALKQLMTDIEYNKENQETYAEKIKTKDQAVSQRPEKEKNLIELRERHRLLNEYLQIEAQVIDLNKNVRKKEEVYQTSKSTYTKAETAWLHNQASFLASHLQDGEACPVCGSEEHPNKAHIQNDEVTKERLESLKNDLNKKEEAYRTEKANHQAIAAQLREKTHELEELQVKPASVKQVRDSIIAEGKKLKEEVDQLKQFQIELNDLRANHDKVSQHLKQLEIDKEQLEKSHHEHRLNYEKQQAVFTDRIQKIPKELQVLAELEKQINETDKRKEQLEKSWEQIQKKLQQIKQQEVKVRTDAANVTKQYEETTIKCKDAEKQFQEALEGAGFDTEETYRLAKVTDHERKALKESIDYYNQKLTMVTQHVVELKESLKNKERVQLKAIYEQLEQLKNTSEQALNAWNRTVKYQEEIDQLIKNITMANEEVKNSEKQLSMMTDLYDVIRGQNHQKISFERYLQIEYLEQIIDAANHRLRDLSNGQFLLIRSDRQESHGRQSGLALDVYDAYTGQTRDVKTLSGGEKFNASLCLALGMSDVIQSFQGNISIETMFIDEGFGSLDEESLNKSIEALIDLQESGRMIGVISHVQELKTIFPAVLEVTKTKAGFSQTKFVVK